MFRHKGKARTFKHNLRIASLLSFVAGIVNVVGFLAVQRLTTNVTGHFAFFVDELFKLNFAQGLVYFLYIFFFFAGSFVSSFMLEYVSRKKYKYMYVIPAIIESLILFSAAIFGKRLVHDYPDLLAFSLLFAMGLQNSFVTTISNSSVRTTHLTGLFTDLGIEISQLFFYREKDEKQKLFSSIRLRFTIIGFFFLGGIFGGTFYSRMGITVLAIAGGILISGILFDSFRLRLILLKRKLSRA
jgi:uncharacterized membrane protein YoaK (UPF0700 family)